jgi:hypothetical protein
MNVENKPNLEAASLASLIQLGQNARQCVSNAELEYVLVNQTYQLINYRQAVYFKSFKAKALSGVVSVEANTPYVQWLEQFLNTYIEKRNNAFEKPAVIDLQSWSQDMTWQDWLPSMLLVLPIPKTNHFEGGFLLLARDRGYLPAEISFLQEWISIWSHAHGKINRIGQQFSLKKYVLHRLSNISVKRRWVMAFVLFILLFPVRLTVLAPAELIPAEPFNIKAPMDGVIDNLQVMPNQHVKTGDVLINFDAVSIQSRLELAQRELATVQASYRRLAQKALYDADSKSDLAVLQSQMLEKQVNVDYLTSLRQRSTVNAPSEGIVLFDDPTQWVGKPVVTGEKIMVLADERNVAIEAWLAPADLIDLDPEKDIDLYLSNSPMRGLTGKLIFISFQPEMRPEGHYAYRVRAELTGEDEVARIGLKGTAKLHGDRVPFIYWMLRRPLAAFRAWIGL